MFKSDIHSCVLVTDERITKGATEPLFECRACAFIGPLEDTNEHIVKNQFVVKAPTK